MTSATRELYQQLILDHNKNPRNFKVLDHFTHMCEGHNPLCGDHVTVYLQVDGGAIKEIGFQGVGCSICKASASLMTTSVKGKTKEEADTLFDEFHRMVKGELDINKISEHHLGRLTVFSNVSEYPVRVKCASLPWHAMHSALAKEVNTSTE